MKACWRAVLCGTVLLLACVTSAAAQEEDENRGGMGAFFDWLHKLSGPPFAGGGLTGYYGRWGEGLRFRVSVAFKVSYNETSAGATSEDIQINLASIQGAFEYGIPDIHFDVGAGAALDLYTGQFTRVSKIAYPVYVQYRSRSSEWAPRIGTGIRLFPAFGPNDFSQLGPLNVKRSGWEIVWQGFGGVEYTRR